MPALLPPRDGLVIYPPHGTLEGEVPYVASEYQATIQLPPNVDGLKPSMTAEVEIQMAQHKNVLTIPLAAVETERGVFCWVGLPDEP